MSAFVIHSPKAKQPSGQPWRPHDYQRRAVKWLLERKAAALFLDPGLGKTSVTYAALKVLKGQRLMRGALVVAPRRPAVSVWPGEHEKWSDFKDLKVVMLHGDKKDDRLRDEEADVYVITYDGLEWLFKEPSEAHKSMSRLTAEDEAAYQRAYAKYRRELAELRARQKLLFRKCDVLIWDELSKMKHSSTVRFKTVKRFLSRFDRRWGLTGSPAANGLEDLFGEVYVLDMGDTFGEYVTHFRQSYFDLIASHVGDEYPTLIPKLGAEDAIYAALGDIALRIDAEDHIKMPKIIPVPLKFDLPPAVRRHYNTMEQQMFAAIPDAGTFTAKTAAVVSQKCRQITSGAIYEDPIDPLTGEPRAGSRKWARVHDEKVDMMMDLIEELQGAQLLIAYEFVHEVERIVPRLQKLRRTKDIAIIGGGTSDAKAKRYEDEWNAGRIPELIGHPNSIGHGLNLQGSSAHHILLISGTWNYEWWDQLLRRLKRQGNEADYLYVYSLVARDTIDEAVYAAPLRKRKGQNALFDALKAYQSGDRLEAWEEAA